MFESVRSWLASSVSFVRPAASSSRSGGRAAGRTGSSLVGLLACLPYTRSMAVRVEQTPAPCAVPASPLDEVLRRVNGIRIAQGADPLYELPAACTAWEGGGCVLERAFEDLGILIVDYQRAYGRGIELEHGLGGFIREFDAGGYPGLLDHR